MIMIDKIEKMESVLNNNIVKGRAPTDAERQAHMKKLDEYLRVDAADEPERKAKLRNELWPSKKPRPAVAQTHTKPQKTMIEAEHTKHLRHAASRAQSASYDAMSASERAGDGSKKDNISAARANIRAGLAHSAHARLGGKKPVGEAAEFADTPGEAAHESFSEGKRFYDLTRKKK